MRLHIVALKYLCSNFIFDALSTFPGLFTAEEVKNLYYFKIIRYFQIKRLFKFIDDLLKRIQKLFIHS